MEAATPPPPPRPGRLASVLLSQRRTLRLFLSHPATRTPVVVLYVASFGGALHHAVTTYFYLAVGASEVDIGRLGFVMSAGALVGAPLVGMALDRYGPWPPIAVTAGACAWGCLWRGLAQSLASLRAGAVLLGIGVNLWTVVLGHVVKSFPPEMRSEVLSGFGVQFTVIQLAGKGAFPLVESAMRHVTGLGDDLIRYRIHMGYCTFFCFYGVAALLCDRKNVVRGEDSEGGDVAGKVDRTCHHKHSDASDESEEGGINPKQTELATPPPTSKDSIGPSNESSNGARESAIIDNVRSKTTFPMERTSEDKNRANAEIGKKRLATTISLMLALLLQSISTTVLAVLWPLVARDRFDLSAQAFGILTFASAALSAGAVASFPIVEKMEVVGGRLRCAAGGFVLGSGACLLFCLFSFGDDFRGAGAAGMYETGGGIGLRADVDGGRVLTRGDAIGRLHSRNRFVLHAASGVVLQSALCFLEPSLKSAISLIAHLPPTSSPRGSSSLGSVIGLLQTLGSVGGMVGNLSGTSMYKASKEGVGGAGIFRDGSLPFVVTAALMAASSVLIWTLDEPSLFGVANANSFGNGEHGQTFDDDVERGVSAEDDPRNRIECFEESEEEPRDGCCLALRETTYDLKLD